MGVEIKDNGMSVLYQGRLFHSHYSNKVLTIDQVNRSMLRFIEAIHPQLGREHIARAGGQAKQALDSFFDDVAEEKTVLLAEANKHRAALSYELLTARSAQLQLLLFGLPLTVEVEVIDEDGAVTIEEVPNPLREGYEEGHYMLDGLPLEIEQQVFDEFWILIGTEMVDNPERIIAESEADTIENILADTESNSYVMAIVNLRQEV